MGAEVGWGVGCGGGVGVGGGVGGEGRGNVTANFSRREAFRPQEITRPCGFVAFQ